MDYSLSEAFNQLLERRSGPLHFRFVLQPITATIIAIRAGFRDAATGETPYLWALLFEPSQRRARIRSGWKDISTLFIFAVALDGAYQALVFHTFPPLQALIVAAALAIVPYVIIRGPIARLARRRGRQLTRRIP